MYSSYYGYLFTASPGFAITGGQDYIINIWEIGGSAELPRYSLLGHTDNVCALNATADATVISGSWDRYVASYPLISLCMTPQ